MTGRVRTGVARVKERQQHATGFQHRPQSSHHRLHQALIQIVRQIPAQNDVEVGGGIDQVVGEKFAAVENRIALLVFGEKFGIGRGSEQIFAVDSVATSR